MTTKWTPDEETTLRTLCAERFSPAQIGERMGRTAASVSKKMTRMGLRSEAGVMLHYTSTGCMSGGNDPKPPRHLPAAPLSMSPVDLHGLKLMTCRFPVGEETGVHQLYCGGLRQRGAYCRAHAAVAYVEARK